MSYRRITVDVLACRCERCGYEWQTRGVKPPVICAKCKSRSWDTPPGSVRLGRPPKKRAKRG